MKRLSTFSAGKHVNVSHSIFAYGRASARRIISQRDMDLSSRFKLEFHIGIP